MAVKKLIILFLLVLFFGTVSADSIFWLRGNDEMLFADNSIYYSLHEIGPDELSTTTTITKTASSGTGEWARFYHEGLQSNTELSGSVSVWFSETQSNDSEAKMRFRLSDFNPTNSLSTEIVSSNWKTIINGFSYQDSIDVPTPYTIVAGHKLKLVIEYQATPGSSLSLIVDESSPGQLLSWAAPNSIAYDLEGVGNAGALLLSASGLPAIECSQSSECNDSNPNTTDLCYYPGTYASFCSNETDGCNTECSSNSACVDGSGGTCLKPGSCSSYCEYTEAFLFQDDDSEVICNSNNQCDDGIDTTIDLCENAGTTESYCSNATCPISCYSDSACDDGNPITNDLCVNAGTCESACNSTSCNPVCTSSSDCDDGNTETTDVCTGAGRCTATCENLTTIGNGTCDAGETECSAPADCGTCGGSISSVYEFACIGNSCKKTIKLGVCGNNRCEKGEDYFACASDCKPQNIAISFSFPDNFYVRGETVEVIASLTVDDRKVPDAKMRATGFFGDIPMFNDGKHNDGTRNDNIYGGSFTLDSKQGKDLYPVTVYAEIGGVTKKKVEFINVSPKISSKVGFNKPVYILGDNIVVNTEIDVKGNPITLPVKFSFERNGETLKSGTADSVDGLIETNYRTTLIDLDGNYTFRLSAADFNNNSLDVEKQFLVLSPDATNFLVVKLTGFDQGAYKKGSEVNVVATVSDIEGLMIDGAIVSGSTSTGIRFKMVGKGNGTYEGSFNIPANTPAEKMSVIVEAVNQSKQGSGSDFFDVIPLGITVEIVEPAPFRNVQAGEELKIVVRASYETGNPVVSDDVFAYVQGEKIKLVGSTAQNGLFEGVHIVKVSQQSNFEINIEVNSGYGDFSKEIIEVNVTGISYQYYLRQFGISIVLLLFALALSAVLIYFMLKKRNSLSGLKKREKQMLEKIKGVQTQYFVEGTIDKKAYDNNMEKLEPELHDIRESINELVEKGKK